MERSLHLYRDVLGLELAWRLSRVGGKEMASLFGLQEMEAEMAYLRADKEGLGVELLRLTRPAPQAARSGPELGAAVLCLHVEGLDNAHQRLAAAGWVPLTPCRENRTPEGQNIRMFCVRTDEGLILELFE